MTLKKILARIWLFLWPPIDDSPIEPQVAAAAAEATGPSLFTDAAPAPTRPAQPARIPPHQRYRVVASDDRWRVYGSFQQPQESAKTQRARRSA
jgi:hypothetical protein